MALNYMQYYPLSCYIACKGSEYAVFHRGECPMQNSLVYFLWLVKPSLDKLEK